MEDFFRKDLTTSPQDLYHIVEKLERQREQDYENFLLNPQIADTIYDDYGPLLKVLNQDKIVQIENYLIQVDIPNHKVYTIPADTKDAYQKLLSPSKDQEIRVFSTDDEVLSALKFPSQKQALWPCRDVSIPNNSTVKTNPECQNGRTLYRSHKKVAYQKAGIWFGIMAEVKQQKRRLRVWWRDYSSTPQIGLCWGSITPRCENTYGVYEYADQNSTYESQKSKTKVYLYGRGRGLKQYDISVTFYSNCSQGYVIRIHS